MLEPFNWLILLQVIVVLLCLAIGFYLWDVVYSVFREFSRPKTISAMLENMALPILVMDST